MSDWWVYICQCNDGSLYTGITTDLHRRMAEHNEGPKGARYTRSRRPVRLVYDERVDNRQQASVREHQIKRMSRLEKQALMIDLKTG